MKRFLVGVMVVTVLFIGSYCFAEGGNDILTYQTKNTSGSLYSETLVPVTSIYPTIDNILGFSVTQLSPLVNSERVVSLYDQTTAGITSISGECLGEAEAVQGGDATVFYPYPRMLNYGLLIRQGPNTVVTIYFSRR